MRDKAVDAALLTQGKDGNAVSHEKQQQSNITFSLGELLG